MKRFFLALVCAVVMLGNGRASADAYRAAPPWHGKYVVNYTATYKHSSPVRSFAVFDRVAEGAATFADCERIAFVTIMAEAARRNPTATNISYGGWAGTCWNGTKPAEPLAWSSFAHGLAWF